MSLSAVFFYGLKLQHFLTKDWCGGSQRKYRKSIIGKIGNEKQDSCNKPASLICGSRNHEYK